MEVYLVVGYFKYEGCEPLAVYSTLDQAIAACKKQKGWDGTEVYLYTLDSEKEGKEVHKEVNKA